jgi:hypothetical protein
MSDNTSPKPVAWRVDKSSSFGWVYFEQYPSWHETNGFKVEPLYAAPQPAQAGMHLKRETCGGKQIGHICPSGGDACQYPNCVDGLAAQAAPAPLTDWRHIANEWADMATSCVTWMQNVKEGISSPANALANMAAMLTRCRAAQRLAAPGVPPPDAAQAPDEVVADYKANIRAYLQEGAPGVPPQPTSGVLAGALTAPEYLAKIEADPAKSAALQRARDRAAIGVKGPEHG